MITFVLKHPQSKQNSFAWFDVSVFSDNMLLLYTQTGIHVGQNFDWVRYFKIAGSSTSLMWRFEFGAIMQNVVCSLHFATFTQI